MMKTPEQHHWSHSGVIIANFQQISHMALVFLVLVLNKDMADGSLESTRKEYKQH